MSLAEPHSHMTMGDSDSPTSRESIEPISAFPVDFSFPGFCFRSFFPFLVHQFSPDPDVSFFDLRHLIYTISRKSSSRFSVLSQSPHVRMSLNHAFGA